MLILGLDPGSLHTGYGVVRKEGSRLTALSQGRFSFPASMPLAQRLAGLTASLDEILVKFAPDAAVLESPYHGLNARSLIVLAQARGAILALLGSRGIAIAEYSPAEIKTAVTGSGRADKAQVGRMVEILLSIESQPRSRDSTDALAAAICYAQRYRVEHLEAQ